MEVFVGIVKISVSYIILKNLILGHDVRFFDIPSILYNNILKFINKKN